MRPILGRIVLFLSLALTPVAAAQDVAAQQRPEAAVGSLPGGTSIVAVVGSTISSDKLKVGDMLQLQLVAVHQPCPKNPLPRGGTVQVRVSFVKGSTHEDPGARLGLIAERIVWPNRTQPLRALLAAAWKTQSDATPSAYFPAGPGQFPIPSPNVAYDTYGRPCSPLAACAPSGHEVIRGSSSTGGPSLKSDWKVDDSADPAVGRVLVSEKNNIKLEEGSSILFNVPGEGPATGPAPEVPNGTVMFGRPTSTVDTSSAHVGDQVTFLSSVVCVGEVKTIPSGTKLLGRITDVQPYTPERRISRLSLILESAEWEGGSIPLHAFVVNVGKEVSPQDLNVAADPALGTILVSRTNNVHLPAGALVLFKQWKTQ